jgi:hypothetical protein
LKRDIRNEFIKEFSRSRVVSDTSLNSLLNKVAKVEHEKRKDIVSFSEYEILDMYKGFNLTSTNTLQNYNNYLKAYCDFIIYKTQKGNNNFTSINKDMLKTCINDDIRRNKYISYEQLQNIELELLNATDAAILECLWHGIAGKELSDLTHLERQQVNKDKMEITLSNNKKIQIYPRLYELLDKAFEEEEYMCYGNEVQVKRVDGRNQLYKMRDNAYKDTDEVRFRWVYRKIMIIRDYVGLPHMSMKSLQGSGMLHYIQEGMKNFDGGLREFLGTSQGEKIMEQYGFVSANRINTVYDKFEEYV